MQNFKELIWSYLDSRDIASLKALLNDAEELEILAAVKELSSEKRVIVYRLLTKERALFVFEKLDTSSQQKLLSSFAEEKVVETISNLPPDDRVRLLEELPATVAKKLIASLSPSEREITNVLMGYEPETAGREMTTQYIALKKYMTVDESFKKIRQNAEKVETIYTLYVTSNSRELEGVLSLKDLVLAESGDNISDIMQKNVIHVSTDTDREEVAKILQKFDLLAVPVVDKENRLVGIITVDDIMDIIEEEVTEDLLDSAGIADIQVTENSRSETLIFGSLWQIWKLRLPFLALTLIWGLLAGVVIDSFEKTLASVAAVAVFIPIIMGMGGNVGTQSATVFTRGLILGQIKMKHIRKRLIKELFVGASIGVLVGTATGLVAYFWHGMPELGIAVGLALIFATSLAATLGFLVPYTLVKLGFDQAAGTGPIITSIKDITGLLVYFSLTTLFLGHLL